MKITLNKTDLYSADCTLHEAIFIISNKYWMTRGEKQFKMYKEIFKKLKRRKKVDQIDFDHTRIRIQHYTEIENALKFLRTADFNNIDEKIYTNIDTIMKYRGILWH